MTTWLQKVRSTSTMRTISSPPDLVGEGRLERGGQDQQAGRLVLDQQALEHAGVQAGRGS